MSVLRGESRRCRKGQHLCLPFLLLQMGILRVRCRGGAAVVGQEGVQLSLCHPVCQAMGTGKPLQGLKWLLFMLWLQSWLTEKAGSKDLTPAVLGCLGAVPDTAAVPPCTGGRAAEGLQCLAFTEVCSWLFIAVVG